MKVFNQQFNIGKARYVLNSHDGQKTHKDGSPFFDIEIASNKRQHAKNIKALIAQGYVEKTFWA